MRNINNCLKIDLIENFIAHPYCRDPTPQFIKLKLKNSNSDAKQTGRQSWPLQAQLVLPTFAQSYFRVHILVVRNYGARWNQ